ncbi:MAG: hypothetical protein NTW86_01140 [Candidatus Sumerlaeota bacterium]|nr:hypothetical protein [Candidatus Sumerlaeota bacterium]
MADSASVMQASSPRSSRIIREQLADLASVKKETLAYGTPDFASRMGRESILRHEAELQEELRAAELIESGANLEIGVEGEPVEGNAIHAAFLGRFLSTLQNLGNAVAQVLTSEPTSRSSVPRNIIAENRLAVLPGFLPGSFRFRFRLPTKEDLSQMFEPASTTVLEAVGRMLEPGRTDSETVRILTHSRVKSHYTRLLDLLAKQGASIDYRTRPNPYGVKISTPQVRERIDWLDLLQAKEESSEFAGVLVGGSIESKHFELRVGEQVIRGEVSEGVIEQMRSLKWGDTVVARLKVTTFEHEEGVAPPSISYLAEDIHKADGALTNGAPQS